MKEVNVVKVVLVVFLVFVCRANAVVVTDDFSDGDYTSNPTWVVNTGAYHVVDEKLYPAYAIGDNTIYLDFDSWANTPVALDVTVNSGAYGDMWVGVDIAMMDSASGKAYWEYARVYAGWGGNSGFNGYDSAGNVTGGVDGQHLNYSATGISPPNIITMVFDPTLGITVYNNGELAATMANYQNMIQCDRIAINQYYSGSSASIGWGVWSFDDVSVTYVPEPATMLLLLVGGLVARRSRA